MSDTTPTLRYRGEKQFIEDYCRWKGIEVPSFDGLDDQQRREWFREQGALHSPSADAPLDLASINSWYALSVDYILATTGPNGDPSHVLVSTDWYRHILLADLRTQKLEARVAELEAAIRSLTPRRGVPDAS